MKSRSLAAASAAGVTVELTIVAAENSPIEVSEAAGTDVPMSLSAIGVEHGPSASFLIH
jgi:hypothetical protein